MNPNEKLSSKVGYMADYLLRLAESLRPHKEVLTHFQVMAIVWYLLKKPDSLFQHKLVRRALKYGVGYHFYGGNGGIKNRSPRQIFCRLFGVYQRHLLVFEENFEAADKMRMYEYAILIVKRGPNEIINRQTRDLEIEVIAAKYILDALIKLLEFFDRYHDHIPDPMERLAIVYRATFIPGLDVQPHHLERVAQEIEAGSPEPRLTYAEIIQQIARVDRWYYDLFESLSGPRKLAALKKANSTVNRAIKHVQDKTPTRAF